MAAVEQVVTMREGLRQMERNRELMYMIRCEDLVEDLRAELSGLLHFCELLSARVFLLFVERQLAAVSRWAPFDLPPAVRQLFEETMKMVG